MEGDPVPACATQPHHPGQVLPSTLTRGATQLSGGDEYVAKILNSLDVTPPTEVRTGAMGAFLPFGTRLRRTAA